MSKAAALYVGLTLIALFGLAIVTLVSAYIGLQVWNNGVIGKNFDPDYYKAVNQQKENI